MVKNLDFDEADAYSKVCIEQSCRQIKARILIC